MPLEPSWWYGEDPFHLRKWLAPAAHLYGAVAKSRYRRVSPYRSSMPVISVGNLTAGGSGKTPLVIAIAKRLIALGRRPVFLSRGYGGSCTGPEWLDEDRRDAAVFYGDEPLMLARLASVMIARDRAAGARAIEAGQRADVIVMDDGLQNPSLHKTLSIAVIDAGRGIGNGAVIPAGPLRAPLEYQLGLVGALIVSRPLGDPVPAALDALTSAFPGPALSAHVSPAGDTSWLASRRVVAFAGIAGPDRFFRLLADLGAIVVEARSFPDHHPFSASEADDLFNRARNHEAQLVTTEKDHARMTAHSPALAQLRAQTRVLSIEMAFDEPNGARLQELLAGALSGEQPSRS